MQIKDATGHLWAYSEPWRYALEKIEGKQIPINQKLEWHETLETKLVFDMPTDIRKNVVVIEEGPFITKLLFPGDVSVFEIE